MAGCCKFCCAACTFPIDAKSCVQVILVPPPISLYSTALIHVDEGHQIQAENKITSVLASELAAEKPLFFVSINPLVVVKQGLSHSEWSHAPIGSHVDDDAVPPKYYEALLALLYP